MRQHQTSCSPATVVSHNAHLAPGCRDRGRMVKACRRRLKIATSLSYLLDPFSVLSFLHPSGEAAAKAVLASGENGTCAPPFPTVLDRINAFFVSSLRGVRPADSFPRDNELRVLLPIQKEPDRLEGVFDSTIPRDQSNGRIWLFATETLHSTSSWRYSKCGGHLQWLPETSPEPIDYSETIHTSPDISRRSPSRCLDVLEAPPGKQLWRIWTSTG